MPYNTTKILTLAIAPFLLESSVNLLWYHVCAFYCSLRKKSSSLLPEGTDVHIQQHIHQKYSNLCHPLYYAKVTVEKTQTRD